MQDLASTLVGMSPIELDDDADDTKEKKKPAKLEPLRRARKQSEPAFVPEPPRSIEATGLSRASLEALCLKHLFQAGELRGGELSRRVCLPSAVVDEVLEHLRAEQLADIAGSSGTGLGRSAMIFRMTEAGQKVCAVAMERDRYKVTIERGEPLGERWVRCRRPMVFVGGELVLEELDLACSPEVRFYEAPPQMKASCGVLLRAIS